MTASISNEQSIIDGYNLRNEEFPRGKDYYSQLASAAFNKPYWECTEFRRPLKVEETLEKVPADYYLQLEDGKLVKAKDIQLGSTILTEVGFKQVKKIIPTPGGFSFEC